MAELDIAETPERRTALAARRLLIWEINPLAKIAAAMILALGLVGSLDPVGPLVALGFLIPLAPFAGVPLPRLLLRTLPVVIAALIAGLTIVLYGRPSGATHWQFWFAHVSDGSLELGLATGLRMLAIALPALVLFLSIDATGLADALTQIWKLPSRFVLGALGAMRLAGLFLDDWKTLEQARRARGLGDRGKLRRLGSQAFALFVLSIRRGTALATAMEARGFGAPGPRAPARPSRFGGNDWAFVGLFLVITAIAVAAAVGSGQWRWIFG